MAEPQLAAFGIWEIFLIAAVLMLLFGATAMKAYHSYSRRLKTGEFHPHNAPSMEDVMSGKDVE